MKLSFPEASNVGFCSFFFFLFLFQSLLTQLLLKKHQGKCIKLKGQYIDVFSRTSKKKLSSNSLLSRKKIVIQIDSKSTTCLFDLTTGP